MHITIIRAQGETQIQTREADGLCLSYLLINPLINPKGVGKRMVMDRQKVKTSSNSRRYRVAGRLEVRVSRMVRQVGTESKKQARVKTGRTSKKRIEAGVRENTLVDLKDIQDELAQRARKHRDKYTGPERQETQG